MRIGALKEELVEDCAQATRRKSCVCYTAQAVVVKELGVSLSVAKWRRESRCKTFLGLIVFQPRKFRNSGIDDALKPEFPRR